MTANKEAKRIRSERLSIRTTKEVKEMLIELSERKETNITAIIEALVIEEYYK